MNEVTKKYIKLKRRADDAFEQAIKMQTVIAWNWHEICEEAVSDHAYKYEREIEWDLIETTQKTGI